MPSPRELDHDPTLTALLFLNDTAVHLIRIAFAVYVFSPLSNGDFATTFERFLKIGILLLTVFAGTQAMSILGWVYGWVCRAILEAELVRALEAAVLGWEIETEIAVRVLKLGAMSVASGFAIRLFWNAWREGRTRR